MTFLHAQLAKHADLFAGRRVKRGGKPPLKLPG
jgi:hypothetical protein